MVLTFTSSHCVNTADISKIPCYHRASKVYYWRCTNSNNNAHLFRHAFSLRPSRPSDQHEVFRTKPSRTSLRSLFTITRTTVQQAVEILREPLSHVSLQNPAHPLTALTSLHNQAVLNNLLVVVAPPSPSSPLRCLLLEP
ncbi:hypothetical protein ElyMa_002049100 [Elysia marginata]|uniref:FLYWCH-type domain-containing protein n=1 Tax=Elysia marginata TaxID=1093978 RepID=A0AAV4F7Q0_9GAST|nr:hypothetical protein ElyMa_002049100 [Elysia marginata]